MRLSFLTLKLLPKKLTGLGLVALLSLSALPMQAAPVGNPAYMRVHPCRTDPLDGLMVPRQRTRKSLNQIYEFDRSKLGNRIPVILVPGRAEEFQHDSWWKRFNQVTNQSSEFQQKFKLYVFLYDSKEELDAQAKSLASDLKKRFGHLPEQQPLMLIAYSLGGVMAREIFEDEAILERVNTLFAISVPFHGSPIFEPAWFSEFLNPPHRSPMRRFWDRTFYRAYMLDKSNLTRGMGWDNFDSSKPQFHVDNMPHLVGDQVNVNIPTFEEYRNAKEIRDKTIVYASYLENELTRDDQNPQTTPSRLRRITHRPAFLLGAVLPIYGFTVHSVFRYTNYQLANLPTHTMEDPQGKNTYLYRYNDGAIPLSSMLFLRPTLEPYAGALTELLEKSDVQKARVFAELDHVDMGEYNLRKSRLSRPDLAHPHEGVRSPNQWIIYDLFRQHQALSQKTSAP